MTEDVVAILRRGARLPLAIRRAANFPPRERPGGDMYQDPDIEIEVDDLPWSSIVTMGGPDGTAIRPFWRCGRGGGWVEIFKTGRIEK